MRKTNRIPATDERDAEEIRAHGQLPHADIDIVYRRARDSDAEFIGISIQTFPFPHAFGRLLAMSVPFRFWSQMLEAAWQPWLRGLRAMERPSHNLALPRSGRSRRASD